MILLRHVREDTFSFNGLAFNANVFVAVNAATHVISKKQQCPSKN